jgi:hypothetical protein
LTRFTEEGAFVAAQRQWERAATIVDGAPTIPLDPEKELVFSPGPGLR